MDIIRWPYQTTMRVRLADGSFADQRVQWYFADAAAKPLKYPHSYGSSNYYDPQDFDKDGAGELIDDRLRARKPMPPLPYSPLPCPDNADAWNAYTDLE